ncbi:transcriptional repressor [PVC group bacterium]|nr:transcriptional repressor [PVC group bacterium]
MKGIRFTPERDVIIEEIYREDTHFDIDSIFVRIRNHYPKVKIAKGSVYRNLPHLISSGLIRESYVEEGHICYEHLIGHSHHDHMKCLGCGRILEFYDDGIHKLQEEVCKKLKFMLAGHVHVLLGYCEECQSGKKQ